MKLLFIVNIEDLGFEEPLGVLYLSASAKGAGHEVYAADNTFEAVDKKIREVKPDLLCVSALTPSFPYLYKTLKAVRDVHDIPSVVGGPHPTYFAEILDEPGIDYIFRGECDNVWVDFLNKFENAQPLDRIQNLSYFREDGTTKHNKLSMLVEDLDTVIFPDRDLLNDFRQFRDTDVRSVIASRGCPYNCSYCFNNQYQEMYKDMGAKLRLRSVDNVIAECKDLKERYKPKMLHFFDDIFPFKPGWIGEFAEKYSREIGLPFITNTSLNVCSEHYLESLRIAGCKCLMIGVETGNEYLREKVLFRKMKNPMMVEKSALIRSKGIHIYAQNLIGIPHGSLEADLETLRLNIAMKADYSGAYLCQPYPGTPVEKIAKEAGLLKDDGNEDFGRSFYYSSNIEIPDKEKVERLRILFPLVVSFPFLLNFIYLLLRIPSGPFQLPAKLLHGYKIKTTMLVYKMGFRSFMSKLILFFSRSINKMSVKESKK